MADRESGDVDVARPKRPRGVTIVVVLSLVEATLIILIGVAVLVLANGADLSDEVDLDELEVRIAGGILVAFGLVQAVLTILLARGSEKARSAFGLVQSFQVATAVYALVALRDVQLQSVWALALPVLVLWLLYGRDDDMEFFAR